MTTLEYNKIVSVPIGDIELEGELSIPHNSRSLVIFSHGSGSSRLSTRNNFVARELQQNNISTFLFNLLTKEEAAFYPNRFNIELLTERLIIATKFITEKSICSGLKVGYFGASTGAASALFSAISLPTIIKVVVSRGGRPDLAMDVVTQLNAPTLLIVGELDNDVLRLNQHFYDFLMCEKKLEVISGATHLFEEEVTLEQVADLAVQWFTKYLVNSD